MKKTDQMLREQINIEEITVPASVHTAIEETLMNLPETEVTLPEEKRSIFLLNDRRMPAKMAAACLVAFVAIPNVSPTAASAMEKIPVVGDVVRVITVRNYMEEEGNTKLDVTIPEVQMEGEKNAKTEVNTDIRHMTDTIIKAFEKDQKKYGKEAHRYTKIDYKTITNTNRWFTLQLVVTETAASSDTNYRYYHIDKSTGEIVKLQDLFKKGSDYQKVISADIRRQMKEQMAADEGASYWLDAENPEWSFESIEGDANYYISPKGELVIVFDQFQVGPGSMGTPEFVIPAEVYRKELKGEYKELFGR